MVHASLFSGIGGPEVASAMLGWENAFHCEINPFGRRVLEYWFPESESYEDITKTDFTKWRGRIDVLTGGFPCQPFSYAGKRGGREDERYLWPEMLRAIDEIRPTWVVGENVAGITTMVEGGVLLDMGSEASLFQESDELHRYVLEQTFTIERICGDLERAGYSVQPVLIPAAAVGAPHRRDRVFIIARIVADTDSGGKGTQAAGGRTGGIRSDGHVQQGERKREAERTDGLHPVSGSSEDPERHGCCQREHEVKGSQRDEWDTCAGDTVWIHREERAYPSDSNSGGSREVQITVHAGITDGDMPFCNGKQRASSYADGKGLQESQQPGRGEDCTEAGAGMDDRVVRPRRDEDAADTDTERLPASLQSGLHGSEERDGAQRHAFHTSNDAWIKGTWWDNFPTQSPVHAGNDGIPIRLDGISIPFNKWRTESLKAYGNAIVPQVMYRIFQAIEEVES